MLPLSRMRLQPIDNHHAFSTSFFSPHDLVFLISAASYPLLSFSFEKTCPPAPPGGNRHLSLIILSAKNPSPRRRVQNQSGTKSTTPVWFSFAFRHSAFVFMFVFGSKGKDSVRGNTNGTQGYAQPAYVRTRRMVISIWRSGLPPGSRSVRDLD